MFASVVTLMDIQQIKIACMYWHTTISAELYSNLLNQTNTIPEIFANFNITKYRHIALWLYLTDAFDNMTEEDLVQNNGISSVECFKERIEYLRRIVIDGMSESESYDVYLDFILNDRIRYLNEVSRRLHYDVAAVGFANPYIYGGEQVKFINQNQFSFHIEQVDPKDFKKDVFGNEEVHTLPDCPICYENITSSCVVLGCNHNLCSGCFVTYLKSRTNNINCAICRASIIKVKTYTEECATKLKPFIRVDDESASSAAAVADAHVPERFEDGDNIVINLV
jgi:hypothetical protein